MRINRVRGHSFIADPIGADSQIVDLGMNEGRFAMEMVRRYGCRVTGVEANPMLAQRLAALGNPTCVCYAIAPERGALDFYIDPTNSEASSLTKPTGGAGAPVQVAAIPLAAFLDERAIPRVDLLKVDIEGAEIDLLMRTDASVFGRIAQITVEFHAFRFPEHTPLIAGVIERMQRIGFEAFDFSRAQEDTLFVNRALLPLTELDRLSLLAQKYAAGIGRVAQRSASGALQKIRGHAG